MPDGRIRLGPAMLRFKLNYDKCIQGIALLASKQPGITQYYIGKVFFFADREHLLDWGRPISGDRYVAMEHGPVPSVIYDMLKDDSGLPDEVNERLASYVTIVPKGNKRHVFVASNQHRDHFSALSEAEKETLLSALRTYGVMSFDQLRNIAHDEIAWADAWATGQSNATMDYEKLIPSSFDNRESFLDEIRDRAGYELA